MNVDNNDIWTMLLSTVRYSMGRQTGMVSRSQELVFAYIDALSLEQIRQIRDEVRQEVEMHERSGTKLGAGIDHRSWKQFVEDLDDRLAPQEVHES